MQSRKHDCTCMLGIPVSQLSQTAAHVQPRKGCFEVRSTDGAKIYVSLLVSHSLSMPGMLQHARASCWLTAATMAWAQPIGLHAVIALCSVDIDVPSSVGFTEVKAMHDILMRN